MAKSERKGIIAKSLLLLAGVFFVIALWEIISFATDALFLPEFFKTVGRMFSLLGENLTFVSIGYSLLGLIVSFSISVVAGSILGWFAGYFAKLATFLHPMMVFLKAIPTIALVLLLSIYVPHFSYYIVFIVLFPIIYQAALEGSNETCAKYDKDFKINGTKFYANLFKIVVPLSMNYLLLGMIQAVSLGMKIQIMAETFSYKSNTYGLGKLIYLSYSALEYEDMMAYVLISLILALSVDSLLYLLRYLVEKKTGVVYHKLDRNNLV